MSPPRRVFTIGYNSCVGRQVFGVGRHMGPRIARNSRRWLSAKASGDVSSAIHQSLRLWSSAYDSASPLSANKPTIWKPSAGLPHIKIVPGMVPFSLFLRCVRGIKGRYAPRELLDATYSGDGMSPEPFGSSPSTRMHGAGGQTSGAASDFARSRRGHKQTPLKDPSGAGKNIRGSRL